MLIYFFLYLFLIKGLNSSCLIGQYLVAETCYPCDKTCLTCNGPASLNCISCNSTRELKILNNQTVCSCKIGFKQYEPIKDSCQKNICRYVCDTCENIASDCYSCGQNRDLNNNCICLNGYYEEGKSTACKPCHYSCKTCIQPNKCATCNQLKQRIYHQGTGLCACKAGFVDLLVQQCSTNNPSSGQDVTIIVGIVVPIGIIEVLTVLVLLTYKKLKKKKIKNEQSNQQNSQSPKQRDSVQNINKLYLHQSQNI